MNPLDNIMGVQEASARWGISSDHVKRLCQDKDVQAKKIGKTWVIAKNQPNPQKYKRGGNKMRETFTVVVKEEPGHPDIIADDVLYDEAAAIEQAEAWVDKYPDKMIYIEYYRPSDGQQAYLNRSGYDLSGESWTDA